MAKKFFYNKVYNTKRTIINLVIVGVCIIGVIVCFILTSNFQGENKEKNSNKNLNLIDAFVEVNEPFTNEVFFSKIENVDVNELEVTYPDDFDISKTGKYPVIIEISGKKYNTTLTVEDTKRPELVLKEVTINVGDEYSAKDFVESCEDNSKEECGIAFYPNSVDDEGNPIDYSTYKEAGVYTIKISATDNSGNQNVQEGKLTIKEKGSEPPVEDPTPQTCKYGNNEYDTEKYLLTYDVTANKCALSLDKYKSEETTKEINKIIEAEDARVKREVEGLKLHEQFNIENAKFSLSNNLRTVVNKTGDGIVGYELSIIVKFENNGEVITIVEYKLDNNGKRIFITNPYNLSE